MSVLTRTASTEILLEKFHNGIKTNKVPYMGCQSLLYQSKINKESSARHETCKSLDYYEEKPTSIPTSILIHQESPQSIPSFSTYRSDRTVLDRASSSNHTTHGIDTVSDMYDMPPNDNNCNAMQTNCANKIQLFPVTRVRKRPSLLKRQSKLSSNSSLNGNKNLLSLCVGSRSPTFKHSDRSINEFPEVEQSPCNRDSVFLSQQESSDYKPINSWETFFSSFSLRSDSQFFWTRNSLKKPVLTYVEKNNWKSAIKTFNVIQKYMGDRRTRKSPSELITILNKHASNQEALRDEILIQICRQTINNPDFRSRSRGWELLSECLLQFSPSNKLLPYLDGFLLSELFKEERKSSFPMNNCLNNLRKVSFSLSLIRGVINQEMQQSVVNSMLAESYQNRQRSFSENIQFGIKEPISFFHQSLQTIMKQQSNLMPSESVPIVLSILCGQLAEDFEESDSFLSMYRSIYSPKELSKLVTKLDKWCCSLCETGTQQTNQHNSLDLSSASLQLLIYWFENLSSPVISQQMAFMRSLSLKDLSKINKRVVSYIVDFLQVHVISKSKDNVRNMASFLCTLIFQLPKDKFYPLDEPKDSVYLQIISNVFRGQ